LPKENACGMNRLLCYVPALSCCKKAIALSLSISSFPAFFLFNLAVPGRTLSRKINLIEPIQAALLPGTINRLISHT
jgi:hypothetical protein